MRAWIIKEPGGPEVFELVDIPTPEAKKGWVLIRVKAFGLNRSEYFTRIGESPTVKFPRVLGIECVGEVVDGGDTGIEKGQKVAAMMNGMGRQFDGSYAEFTLVPKSCVFPLNTQLSWEKLGALPEMLQTTYGSLFKALEIDRASSILIRGGTSSVGLAALALAKDAGLTVGVTSRNKNKIDMMKSAGADEVWVDDGHLSKRVLAERDEPYDRVLELIGTTTLLDSLRCVNPGGIVCMTGILGGQWELQKFHPMGDIPTAVKLTSYSGGAQDITAEQLQHYVSLVESGKLSMKMGPVYRFEELHDAHKKMDSNTAGGKIVIRI